MPTRYWRKDETYLSNPFISTSSLPVGFVRRVITGLFVSLYIYQHFPQNLRLFFLISIVRILFSFFPSFYLHSFWKSLKTIMLLDIRKVKMVDFSLLFVTIKIWPKLKSYVGWGKCALESIPFISCFFLFVCFCFCLTCLLSVILYSINFLF